MASFFDRITGSRQKVAITIQDDPNQILEFDAVLNENHVGNANTSDHPVEAGADLTDHIQRTPEELQLVGVVTDTPLVFLASIRAEPSIPGGDPQNRAQDSYGFLKAIKDAGQLVQVTTTLRDYANMAITGLSVIRDKDKGKSVEAALSLREILIATTEQVEAPEPTNPPRKKKTDQGKKQKKAETAANQQQSSSILSDIFGSFG
jgi:hypothetical protein